MNTQVNFKPNNVDIVLALFASIFMPIICSLLYTFTGALIPLLIYYGIFCFGIVYWRRGSLEYFKPKNFAAPYFLTALVITLVWVGLSYILSTPSYTDLLGWILTLVIWAPINAVMEQLLWIYIFDVFALRFEEDKKIIGIVLGTIFCLVVTGLIHILFWTRFLRPINNIFPLYQIHFVLNFTTLFFYVIIYKKTKSMLFIFVLHFITNFFGVITSGYSILPYLIII